MPTYIIIHNPFRPNRANKTENPAQEIVNRIRAGELATKKLATTNFGGWDITRNKYEIKPDNRLLFYRSAKKPTGFFAVGRVLPANHSECRNLREEMIPNWYKKPANLSGPLGLGLAVYKGLRWDTGKVGEISFHINAVWDIVGDPNSEKGQILVPCNINELLGKDGPKQNGELLSDEKANEICAKCESAPNALHAK